MATVKELVKQYETDPELKKEVDDILADGKITMKEFLAFADDFGYTMWDRGYTVSGDP